MLFRSQGLHAMGDQADMRRGRLVGQRFPLRKEGQAVAWGADELMAELEVVKEAFGGFIVGCDDDPGTVSVGGQRRCAGQAREHKRRSRAVQARDTETRRRLLERGRERGEPFICGRGCR